MYIRQSRLTARIRRGGTRLAAVLALSFAVSLTLGAQEKAAPPARYIDIVINEVQSNDTEGFLASDFVELYNRAATAFSFAAGEWYLTDAEGYPDHVFFIPGGTTIGGGGYLVLLTDETRLPADAPAGSLVCLENGGDSAFGLGKSDSVALFYLGADNPDPAAPLDSVSWTAHVKTRARLPDGGQWAASDANKPTPGAANR